MWYDLGLSCVVIKELLLLWKGKKKIKKNNRDDWGKESSSDYI